MLADKLKSAAGQLGADYACLGVYHENAQPRIWKYRAHGAAEHGDTEPGDRHPVLCSIKLFTAALTAVLASLHGFTLSGRSGALAQRFKAPHAAPYGELTLAQLLAHSHGLADCALEQPDGTHWPQRACEGPLQAVRLFNPGRFYSYGAVGYILLGRLMEAVGQAPFGRLLQTHLLEPMRGSGKGHSKVQDESPVICPASGRGLTLSIEDFMAFCGLLTDPGRFVPLLGPHQVAGLLQPRIVMPGWTPYMKASCYGFRDFGSGWYGHNGVDSRHLTWLRIHPEKRAAICLLAAGETARIGALPALVLQHAYPELVLPAGRQPQVLHNKVPGPDHPLLGCYSDSRKRYCCLIKDDRLTLQVYEGHGAPGSIPPAHECFLYPAEDEIYFLSRPWKKTVCVQWLAGVDGTRAYLWDQEQVLPALATAAPYSCRGDRLQQAV